jgi:hypothetical protein
MPNDDVNAREQSCNNPAPGRTCDPDAPAGPPREAGGTTGEGNLSPQQANRTGGATGGVGAADGNADRPARAGTIPPDA